MIFKLIFGGVLLAFASTMIFFAIKDWYETPAEDRDEFGEIIALGRGSLTRSWLRVVGVVGGLLSGVANFADALQLPQVTEAINAYLPAQYVTGAILLIALIGIWTRNRTLPSSEKSVM